MNARPETRIQRLVVVIWGPQLIAVLVVCALWRGDSWHPARLFITLLLLGIVSQLVSLRVGKVYVDITTPVQVLAAALLGVVPCVVICVVSCLSELARRRPPWWDWVTTTASVAVGGLAAGLVFAWADRRGWVTPGTESVPAWVFLASMANVAANAATIMPGLAVRGVPLRPALRDTFLPIMPLDVCSAVVAAATAHAYYTLGFGAIVVFGGFLLVLMWLLAIVTSGERRREALTTTLREREALAAQLLSVGDQERRHLAAELHDGALQRLAVLRQDLTHALPLGSDELLADIDEVEATLREVVTGLGTFGAEPPPVVHQLREVARVIGDRSAIAIQVFADPLLNDARDQDIFACARELLLNVEKHAQASHAWVQLSMEHGRICLEVSDDGAGGRISIAAAVDEGHVGLALIAARAEDRHGALTHAKRPGGGLIARVEFDVVSSAQEAPAHALGDSRGRCRDTKLLVERPEV